MATFRPPEPLRDLLQLKLDAGADIDWLCRSTDLTARCLQEILSGEVDRVHPATANRIVAITDRWPPRAGRCDPATTRAKVSDMLAAGMTLEELIATAAVRALDVDPASPVATTSRGARKKIDTLYRTWSSTAGSTGSPEPAGRPARPERPMHVWAPSDLRPSPPRDRRTSRPNRATTVRQLDEILANGWTIEHVAHLAGVPVASVSTSAVARGTSAEAARGVARAWETLHDRIGPVPRPYPWMARKVGDTFSAAQIADGARVPLPQVEALLAGEPVPKQVASTVMRWLTEASVERALRAQRLAS